jgi:protein-tyrosine phosphatase
MHNTSKENIYVLSIACRMKQRNRKNYAVFFLITDKTNQEIIVHLSGSPKSSSIEEYTRFMKDNAISDIFCFCEPEYDPVCFSNIEINYHRLNFPDGTAPSSDILKEFDKKLDAIIEKNKLERGTHEVKKINQTSETDNYINDEIKPPYWPVIINMHCHTGLGRSPTMLAYLMISRCGYEKIESVDTIRKYRRGAINAVQLNWITTAKIKNKDKDMDKNSFCVIV